MGNKEFLAVIGERIRAARRNKNLTQTELGQLVGYSMNGIAKIERGESDPKFSVLNKVAEVLGMSLSEMVIAPDPSGDEALISHLWGFLRSGDTQFSVEKYNIEGRYSSSITVGNHPYPRRRRAEDEDF